MRDVEGKVEEHIAERGTIACRRAREGDSPGCGKEPCAEKPRPRYRKIARCVLSKTGKAKGRQLLTRANADEGGLDSDRGGKRWLFLVLQRRANCSIDHEVGVLLHLSEAIHPRATQA